MHPPEQFCGRGTRDSTPQDIVNQSQWPPAWASPPWCSGTVNQAQSLPYPRHSHAKGLTCPSSLYNNRLPARGREKPGPGHMIGPMLTWEQRNLRPWERQDYNRRPGGSTHPGTHSQQRGYENGHQYPRHRALPHMGEVWNHTQQSRLISGQKRPAASQEEHSPPLRYAPPPDCGPVPKRQRGNVQRFYDPDRSLHAHPRSTYPPHKPRFWDPPYKGGVAWTSPDRRSGPPEAQPGFRGFGHRPPQPRPSPHGRHGHVAPPPRVTDGQSRNRPHPSPANHTSVPYNRAPYWPQEDGRCSPTVPQHCHTPKRRSQPNHIPNGRRQHSHTPEGRSQEGRQEKHMLVRRGSAGRLDSQVPNRHQQQPLSPFSTPPSNRQYRPSPASPAYSVHTPQSTEEPWDKWSDVKEERGKEKERKRERERGGKKDRERERKKNREKEGKKDREREGKKDREKEGKKDRGKEGKKDRDKEGKKDSEKEGKKNREKEGKKIREYEGKDREKEGKKGHSSAGGKMRSLEPLSSLSAGPSAIRFTMIGREMHEEVEGSGREVSAAPPILNTSGITPPTPPLCSDSHAPSRPEPHPLHFPRAPKLLPVSRPPFGTTPPPAPPC
ncbi:hypothetical protein GJAV_G00128100 [Gymnothorax javanicus]|nr:hypothetical protein GJAV_G00128100 [Gymnothorax javanicus]